MHDPPMDFKALEKMHLPYLSASHPLTQADLNKQLAALNIPVLDSNGVEKTEQQLQLELLHREFQLDRLDVEQLAKFEEARSRIAKDYNIVAVKKLAECFVQHVSMSEDGKNLLMVSSDKELRLMYIDQDVLG